MTYLEAVDLLRNIETKYDVMSIRYKGISVWPHLRLYLLDKISVNTEVKATGTVVKVVLKSLFVYNPLQLWKKHDVWLFTGCERRKRIGYKMIHRISGGISANVDGCLMVEKPSSRIGHYNKNEIEEKHIVSEAWLLFAYHLIELCSRLFKPKIKNEELIRQILLDNNIAFDYHHSVRMLNAKRISMLLLLTFARKPKLAVMECPYVSMGYMWAFHQKGIEVVELQHGVLNCHHNAYNANAYEERMNPDAICVFGIEEYRYFTEDEPQYAKDVYMTGLYMLERADETFNADPFEKYREKYHSIVVASGQNGYENHLSEVIDAVALEHNDILFFYIPRLSDTSLAFKAENVKVKCGVNIYEYLKWADIHITISSTTCLESQYFGTPTIFYDYDSMASNYYGELLNKENGCVYINSFKEFDTAYKILKDGGFKYKEIFSYNHVERITNIIRMYLSKHV